jgi:NAD(P)H-dependent FMN reductase
MKSEPSFASLLASTNHRQGAENMMTISVIVGSTRQGRFSEKPAQWILGLLQKRKGIEGQLLGLRDFSMPFFDQPAPPAMPTLTTTRGGQK